MVCRCAQLSDLGPYRLEYPSHQLVLYKQSTAGSSVGIGVGPAFGYWAEPTLLEACRSFLQKGTANEQLRLAKNKGASKTVLLFDDRIDFDPKIVAQAFSLADGSQLSHIDEAYLVSTFGGGMARGQIIGRNGTPLLTKLS